MAETQEQIKVMDWFKLQWPEHAWSLRPSMNGLSRRGRAGAILWRTMQALGASKGDPDIAILLPKGGFGCFVAEHKAADKPRDLTKEQAEQLDYHRAIGNCAVSTRGEEALKAAIITYMEQ